MSDTPTPRTMTEAFDQIVNQLKTDLTAAREELKAVNELVELWKAWERDTGIKRDRAVKLYIETTKQRDMLAGALNRILPFVDPIIANIRYTEAQQALQSLNQPQP